jgi:hypothetical protein
MKTKKCKGPCAEVKPLSDFHKQSKAKDGVKSKCKVCTLADAKEYYSKNKSECQARSKAWKESNKLHVAEYRKKYVEENEDYIKSYRKEDYQKNKDRYSTKAKVYYEKNREHLISYSKEYYLKNKDHVSEYNKSYYEATKHDRVEDNRKRARDWYHNNRARAISRNRERELKQKSATPKWLSEGHKKQIHAIYEHAKDCSVVSGEVYEVDHIIPLQGKNISGLHVPWNLQVLPMDVNRAKSNKYDPDIQCPTASRAS